MTRFKNNHCVGRTSLCWYPNTFWFGGTTYIWRWHNTCSLLFQTFQGKCLGPQIQFIFLRIRVLFITSILSLFLSLCTRLKFHHFLLIIILSWRRATSRFMVFHQGTCHDAVLSSLLLYLWLPFLISFLPFTIVFHHFSATMMLL